MPENESVNYDEKIKSLEMALTLEREKYLMISDLLDCGIWEYDIKTHTLDQSRKLNGKYQNERLVIPDFRRSVHSWGIVHPADIDTFDAYCDSMDRGDPSFTYSIRALTDGNDYAWIKYEGKTIYDDEGNPLKIVGKTLDIDREMRERALLIEKAKLDPLTGLLNKQATREGFYSIVNALESGPSDRYALFIIDLDDFKNINDTYGHLYGDYVLETFGKILKSVFPDSDCIGRIGGDEFIVVKKNIKNVNVLNLLAQSLCDAVRSARLTKGNRITASVGVSVYPEHGRSFDELYERADNALYIVKKNGKDAYGVFDVNSNFGESETARKQFKEEKAELAVTGLVKYDRRIIDFALEVLLDSRGSSAAMTRQAVSSLLAEIGKALELERITVYEIGDNDRLSISWNWQPVRTKDETQKLLTFVQRYWDKNSLRLRKSSYMNIDLLKANVGVEITSLHKTLEETTSLQCKLSDGENLIGFVAFVRKRDMAKLSDEQVSAMQMITKLISGDIVQIRKSNRLNSETFYINEIQKNRGIASYAIDPETYEIVYSGGIINRFFPEAVDGEICYKLRGKKLPCETCPLRQIETENSESGNSKQSVKYFSEKNSAWIWSTASSVTLSDGRRLKLICVSDMTEFYRRKKTVDPLTGLISYDSFEAEAMKLITRDNREKYAMLNIDFRNFRRINEELGYSVGDEILKLFANQISLTLAGDELFTRVCKDNFLLFLSCDDINEVLARIQMSVGTVLYMCDKLYKGLNAGISCGMYRLKHDDELISVCIDKAGIARKHAWLESSRHNSGYRIFDEELEKELRVEEKMQSGMFRAITGNEFCLFIQPRINIATGEIIGAEALTRWITAEGEMIMPGSFIPVFERNGFIVDLDFYMYGQTFAFIRKLLDDGIEPPVISINVSKVYLSLTNFVDKICGLASLNNVPPKYIEIEITESSFYENLDRLLGEIDKLRNIGFKIAIDNFGASFSSMNLVKILPIDIIKITSQLFRDNKLTIEERDKIRSIIALADSLKIPAVCEGIENEEQSSFVKEIGCNQAQGFYYYRPVKADEFRLLLLK